MLFPKLQQHKRHYLSQFNVGSPSLHYDGNWVKRISTWDLENYSLLLARPILLNSHMQKYFNNIESIDSFSLSLDYHKDVLQCVHCSRNDQFVSHGFVYKQRSQTLRQKVGKRIICSNRYGRSGCGRTYQLYIAEALPCLQYGTAHLFVFLLSLMSHMTVQQAYEKATGTEEPRNAWRWLNKLQHKLIDYRCFLQRRADELDAQFRSRVRRLHILLPTVKRLFALLDDCPCAHYQMHHQLRFI